MTTSEGTNSQQTAYSKLIAQKRARVEEIAEGIKAYSGLKATARPHNIIECDTFAGKLIYHTSESQSIMANIYRFISHYGSKLHAWGLEHALEENKKDRNQNP